MLQRPRPVSLLLSWYLELFLFRHIHYNYPWFFTFKSFIITPYFSFYSLNLIFSFQFNFVLIFYCILLLPVFSYFQYYYGLRITSGRQALGLASILFFGLILCSSVISSLILFFLSVVLLSLSFFSSNALLGLLCLLIYLGSLIVLFAYL